MCRQTGCGVGVDYISIIMMMMCLVTHLNNRSAACHVEGPVTCSWILMIYWLWEEKGPVFTSVSLGWLIKSEMAQLTKKQADKGKGRCGHKSEDWIIEIKVQNKIYSAQQTNGN